MVDIVCGNLSAKYTFNHVRLVGLIQCRRDTYISCACAGECEWWSAACGECEWWPAACAVQQWARSGYGCSRRGCVPLALLLWCPHPHLWLQRCPKVLCHWCCAAVLLQGLGSRAWRREQQQQPMQQPTHWMAATAG